MRPGDIVIVPERDHRKLKGGEYKVEYTDRPPYAKQRRDGGHADQALVLTHKDGKIEGAVFPDDLYLLLKEH